MSLLDRVIDGLAEYVRQKHLEKPVIVGHSLGGFLALKFAIKYPDLPGRIISLDGVCMRHDLDLLSLFVCRRISFPAVRTDTRRSTPGIAPRPLRYRHFFRFTPLLAEFKGWVQAGLVRRANSAILGKRKSPLS